MRFIFLIFKNKFTIKSFFSTFFGKITPFESWMVFTHFGKIFKNEVKNEFRFSAAQNFLNISESENLSAISLSNDITKTEAKSIFTGYNAFEQLRYKPFVGLFNYANQNLPFAKINKYGFQHSSLKISKKINTKRVIIIGGSAAFGYGSSDPNKTLTSYFEKHLNAFNKVRKEQLKKNKKFKKRFDELGIKDKLDGADYQKIVIYAIGIVAAYYIGKIILLLLMLYPPRKCFQQKCEDLFLHKELELVAYIRQGYCKRYSDRYSTDNSG